MKRFLVMAGLLLLVVTSTAVAQSDAPIVIDVLNASDFVDRSPVDIEDLLMALPGTTPYRYGDNPSGTATIELRNLPVASPDAITLVLISPGDVGFGNTESVIGSQADNFITVGDGLNDNGEFAFFIASTNAPPGEQPPGADELFVQTDFVIGFGGMPGWEANESFPGDTWQGGSVVLSGNHGPGQDLAFELIDTNNSFEMIPFSGFYASTPDWVIAAIDVNTLSAYSDGDIKFGFATHTHDGSFGSCEDCLSMVTAIPMVPRTVDDLFSFDESNRIMLEMPPPPTTAPPATEAAVASTVPATTVPSTTPPEVEDEPSDGGGIPWGPVAIFIGAIAAFVYWMMNREDEEGDCEPLLRVWNEEIARTARVRERLEAASEFLNDRLLRVSELESLHAEYAQASEGPRGGSGGLDMVRLEGEMIGYDSLMEMIAETAQQLTEAQDAASRALDEFNDREATYNEQVAAETAAREAYEACIGAKAAGAAAASAASAASAAGAAAAATPPPALTPGPTSGGGDGTSTTPAAPASVYRRVTSYPERGAGCKEQGPVMIPVGSPFRIRLFRDFDVISKVSDASAHGAEKYGEEMATGLKQLGVTLGTVGALLSGGSAGLKGASAAGSFQTGKIVKGSLDAVKGTVSGLQGASVLPPVPTNLPELVVGGLQATANLGSLIAGKVTEWMGDNNLILVRITYFFQTVSIQPTQIWECVDGTWQCKTRVNVYSVGNLEAQKGPAQSFTVKGARDKRRLRGRIVGMTSSGRNRIINSAKAIADWESKNAPGDCR